MNDGSVQYIDKGYERYVSERRSLRPRMPTVAEIISRPYTPQLAEAFPDLRPQVHPCGMLLLCQIRTPKSSKTIVTATGESKTFHFADETKDAEKYQVQTALIRAMGPVAFHRRDTGTIWPEREWVFPGDFIRIPRYGGDRHEVEQVVLDGAKVSALFVMVRDTDVLGFVPDDVDPLSIKTLV